MERRYTVRDGARAGVLGGIAVIALFLIYDAARLTPLATPVEFATVLFGAGGSGADSSGSGLAGVTGVAAALFRVLAYTALHLSVFAGLGALATRLFDRFGIPANVLTGALFGVTVCTLVLRIAFLFVWPPITTAGWAGILVANGVAGAIIGLSLQASTRPQPAG